MKPQLRSTTIFARPTNAELSADILAALAEAVRPNSDMRAILPTGANRLAILELRDHLHER